MRSRSIRTEVRSLAVAVGALALVGVLLPATAARSEPSPEHAPVATAEVDLADRVRPLLDELPGTYTVDVRELDGERRTLQVDAADRREPASTAKVFVAVAVLQQVDEGTIALDTRMENGLTVQQCLRAMIEPSNNECAVGLQEVAGSGALTRLTAAGGFADTAVGYGDGLANVTSAQDVSLLMAGLAEGRLLSAQSNDLLLALLETQIWREAIPPGLPARVRQASKPGTVSSGTGIVQTDTAIVWGPRSRYVITVLGAEDATTESITRISRTVYELLQGPVGTAFEYDPRQMVTIAEVPLREDGEGTAVLATLRPRTPVEVLTSVRDWYLVHVDGLEGWLHNSGLELREPGA